MLGLPSWAGFSLVEVSRGYSLLGLHEASHCGGFSCCGAQALGCESFSSCSLWAQWLRLLSSRTGVLEGHTSLVGKGIYTGCT